MSERKRKALLALALDLENARVRERTGNNDGEFVEWFQTECDGRAQGEPWCMAMLQKVRGLVERVFTAAGIPEPAPQPFTEHCMTFWRATPADRRFRLPQPGLWAIWNKRGTDSGHVALVVSVNGDGSFETFEGNTSAGAGGDQREGQGAYRRTRAMDPMGDLELQGFAEV